MSTSQWTIASWQDDAGDVQLVASVRLKENHKQDVTYLLRFGGEDREIEIDAKDVKILLAARTIATNHQAKNAARVPYDDDSDDDIESMIADKTAPK